jgi:2-dehydro-3-deoxyphosphogluconate aldolase/(4S)-4-hydroxy-2-oxoglutarate aldolase
MSPEPKLAPVILVLEIDRVESDVPPVLALVNGGLPLLEVTLRTPAALESIEAIATEVKGAVVGAGTRLSQSTPLSR